MELHAWLTVAAAEATAASTRESALKATMQALSGATAASDLRKGTFSIVIRGPDDSSPPSTHSVSWDWALSHAVDIAQRLIAMFGQAVPERRGRVGVTSSAVQLSIDILVLAVRECAQMPSAENIARAQLLPHVPAILQICESWC